MNTDSPPAPPLESFEKHKLLKLILIEKSETASCSLFCDFVLNADVTFIFSKKKHTPRTSPRITCGLKMWRYNSKLDQVRVLIQGGEGAGGMKKIIPKTLSTLFGFLRYLNTINQMISPLEICELWDKKKTITSWRTLGDGKTMRQHKRSIPNWQVWINDESLQKNKTRIQK